MTVQLENSLREAEEHLLRAEAEMAKAALAIVEAADKSGDQRLSQLADVISTHTHLVGHLATITVSAFYANLPPEAGTTLLGHRATLLL